MKMQGTKTRDQGTGTREQQTERLAALLRNAVQPRQEEHGPGRDLWPVMRARLHQESGGVAGIRTVPWFDWALAGGVAVCAVVFPAAIPVLLYYL
jgi:hypothetical protein